MQFGDLLNEFVIVNIFIVGSLLLGGILAHNYVRFAIERVAISSFRATFLCGIFLVATLFTNSADIGAFATVVILSSSVLIGYPVFARDKAVASNDGYSINGSAIVPPILLFTLGLGVLPHPENVPGYIETGGLLTLYAVFGLLASLIGTVFSKCLSSVKESEEDESTETDHDDDSGYLHKPQRMQSRTRFASRNRYKVRGPPETDKDKASTTES